tara:strand:+ start:8109 stop:9752 length:1644 start_codon:yes stop_codon:yes gene_type:complete
MANLDHMLPYDYNRTQKAESMKYITKWEPTGLLEGLDDKREKPHLAVLLENQARQIVTEANRTGTASNSEEWAGVALPLVRRIFSSIAAKDFVSIQPMNLPSGLVFFLDFKYGTSQPGFFANQGKNSQKDSVFGITDSDKGGTAGTQGLYGAGRFSYSINDYSSSTLSFTGSISRINTTKFFTGSVNMTSDINYDTNFSASYKSNTKLRKVFVSTDSVSGFDPLGVRAFTVTGTNINDTFQQFTSYDLTNNRIVFIVSGSTTISNVKVNYHKQPTDLTRGDFEEGKTQAGGNKEDLPIPEINLEMRSEAITSKTRKLKAKWTPEFAQDLNAYHSIDAEAELTSMLSEYISQEIDLEILDMLVSEAQVVDRWSARIGFQYDPGTATFTNAATTGQFYNQGTWFQTIGTKMQKVSNEIHRLTMRGGANFIVTSPTIATILESIPGYAADTNGDQAKFAMGVQKVGLLNSRFTVYKNPYMTENLLLMGYRGAQFLETGAVYAPYIPLIMTPLVYDPENFTPRKGIMTRYAKKMVRPEYYGKIYVHGLDSL